VFEETYQALIKRLALGAVPIYRGVGEAMAGKTLYPDPFKARPIRDKGQHIAKTMGVDYITNRLQGKPGEPWYKGLPKALLYSTDTGEASY